MIIDEADYLEHAGKKGMKWGKRSARYQKIASAREYVNSGQYQIDRINNLVDYRNNRMEYGRLAAIQIAKLEKNKIHKQIKISKKAINGREFLAKAISSPFILHPSTALLRRRGLRVTQTKP